MAKTVTTTTFLCDCCACQYVVRLRDCCTDLDVDLAICNGITAQVVIYNGRCYHVSGTAVPVAEAVANGWMILATSSLILVGDDCTDDLCYTFYQSWSPFCGNSEVDSSSPVTAITGPCGSRAAATTDNGYALINGRWYSYIGIVQVRLCETLADVVMTDYQIIDTICYQTTISVLDEFPYCCTICVVNDVTPPFTNSYHVRPNRPTIVGMSFSGCGTNMTGLPDWDGEMFCDSSGYYNTGGNWASSNGYIPGTTQPLVSTNILYYDCEDEVWYLSLNFTWVGSGGGGPGDPTGTYTAIGTPGCSGPSTLTVV